jgi:magnesium-protoporphyrin IX monomethyl ester (oxidative) cyclase
VGGFHRVALLQSHQQLPAWHDYYVPDLVELCMLAAVVRDHVDEVTIPLAPTDRDPFATFGRFVRERRPDLVGISAFTGGARSALAYAEIAKQAGAVVAMGGYHPSALPEEVLASPHVDLVVRGEGEEALAELVRTGSPEGVGGVSYRRNGEIVHNPRRPPIADLDAFPLPLRELRPPRCGLPGLDYHTDTVYASRGCRGKCTFCANHLIGGAWRERGVDGIVRELETMSPARRGRIKHVKFWDSCFLSDPERVVALCGRIREAGLQRRFRFVAETRAEDVIRAADILPAMRAAGFARIGCGVESPNRSTHLHLRKGLNLAHVARAAELLRDAGMQFSKFLIVGHDGEGEADVLAYPDYALEHGVRLQNTTFFVMTPYPGTDLAADWEARGLVESRDWDLYNNFGAVVAPPGLSAGRLQVLHAAVSLKYGALRRFLAGKTVADAVAKCMEPLLLLAKVELQRGTLTPGEVAGRLLDALTAAAGPSAHGRRSRRRRRPGDRIGFRFHAAGRGSVVVGAADRDGEEELVIHSGPGRIPGGKRPEVHVSLDRLVALGARLDYRRLTADALTLYWRPAGFRLAWLPSFARELATVLWAAAGLAAFHLGKAVSFRHR